MTDEQEGSDKGATVRLMTQQHNDGDHEDGEEEQDAFDVSQRSFSDGECAGI